MTDRGETRLRPAAAHAGQHKMESEAEGVHDFDNSVARARVGGVSPRPPDRGRSCTLLGREPLLELAHN